MVYETKQRRLRYAALTIIVLLCLSIVVITYLEINWHVKAD